MTPDMVNGCFELGGAFVLLLNVFSLYKDKKLQGVSYWPVLFFTSWGFWNLYFYPSVGAWWSFYGGIAVLSVQLVWLVMLAYYTRINSKQKSQNTI